jgi:O-antigen biosynthesis protein WbqP
MALSVTYIREAKWAIEMETNQTMDECIRLKHELTDRQKRYLPVKRAIDFVFGVFASIVLAPIMGGLAIAIKIDSPGCVLFKQKRVGKNKKLFEIWKFRTMHANAPKDTPTHMLSNPDAYITRIGRMMRKFSLDELPQIWQIVRGQMSIIGPRPALWNQYDLIEERDKYGANNVTPGLTGWAQINGRDELEISLKAKLDGEYVEKIGLVMDLKCFFKTIGSVLSSDGVVEGRTGEVYSGGVKTGYITDDKNSDDF